jgi:2,4-dienoyl-CoA reductase (NADPH2)
VLFSQVKIKNLTLKNRIVMPAITLNYDPAGSVTQRMIDLYRERARGGAGLIMIGGAAVDADGVAGGFISIHDDQLIEGHRKLVTEVKRAGARVGLQLIHTGRYSFGFRDGKDVVAPSPLASRLTGFTPREMTTDDIRRVVDCFGQAALRAVQAGYDLVEIIASAGYLISQFLSPVTNQRTDEYGGSYAHRMRFGLEVIRTVRDRVGPDFPLSVRLGGNDFMTGGNTMEEIVQFAAELEKASVDLINVTGGWHESYVPQISSEVPAGGYSYLAQQVKSAVNLPVAASNRINDPQIAEEILSLGHADLVSVGRGFLADPDWANKAQSDPASIRKCIACGTCLDHLFSGQAVVCAINPQCGREREMAIVPANDPKKVIIIGAGPAGLEAARVAALKGHLVSLWEKSDTIGGQWNLAAKAPGKEEFCSLLIYYHTVLNDLGVEIKFNTTATSAKVKSAFPDAVIVATGAKPYCLDLVIKGDPPIIDATEVLKGHPVTGPDIVIIGAGSVGCETAVYLAEKGTISADVVKFMMLHQSETPETIYKLLTQGYYNIKVVEMTKHAASDMGKATRWALLKQMNIRGIKTIFQAKVIEINPSGVKVVSHTGEESELHADTVIMAAGSQSNNDLYQHLLGEVPEIHLIGDAVAPGRVMKAIYQAFEVALRV